MNEKTSLYGLDLTKPAWEILQNVRNEITVLRGMLSDFRREWKGWGERTECVEGALTCAISTLYNTVEEIRKGSVKSKGGLEFCVRGIGVDMCPCCFVCGATQREPRANEYLNNIAAFVKSKEEGEKIVAMFDRGARLDWRAYEPNYVQVKVGACDIHAPNLVKLECLTADGGICQEDVKKACSI